MTVVEFRKMNGNVPANGELLGKRYMRSVPDVGEVTYVNGKRYEVRERVWTVEVTDDPDNAPTQDHVCLGVLSR